MKKFWTKSILITKMILVKNFCKKKFDNKKFDNKNLFWMKKEPAKGMLGPSQEDLRVIQGALRLSLGGLRARI